MNQRSIEPGKDWRNFAEYPRLPGTHKYFDQPRLVEADDGTWIIITTCGISHEGSPGQTVVVLHSKDQGQTWSDPDPIEPIDGPEASYGVPLKIPGGRIYVFYNYNADNIRGVPAEPSVYHDGICERVDTLGHFVFRFSDDHGVTWSDKRYKVPIRLFEIDRNNAYGGEIQFFWNVSRTFISDGGAYIPLHKVGGFGDGFITSSEGALIHSPNLLHESDPEKLVFETLPEGEIGIRNVGGGGRIAEEHSFLELSDGTFFSVFRTVDGFSACSYSSDRGVAWEPSSYMQYADGRRIKHPRAATFCFKHSSGKYLYWFHNHGGRDYRDRRIVWISIGSEVSTPAGMRLEFSQPEVLYYWDEVNRRSSYPDLIESSQDTFMAVAHKSHGTFSRIDPRFLETVLHGEINPENLKKDLIFDQSPGERKTSLPAEFDGFPTICKRSSFWEDLDPVDTRGGFTIVVDFTINVPGLEIVLLDSRDHRESGLALLSTADNRLKLILNDGYGESCWKCDPDALDIHNPLSVAIIVDGGPKIISFVTNGLFNDGGAHRQFGYGMFLPTLRVLGENQRLRICNIPDVPVHRVRIYNRALLTCEAAVLTCRQPVTA